MRITPHEGGLPALDGELAQEFAAIAKQVGCELVHAEFHHNILKVVLDRPQGVTIDDCATVSKQLSAFLDVSDFGGDRYTLEVSSPGLDRQLYDTRDYERFRGQLARVTFTEPDKGTDKRTVVGRLAEFRPGEETGRGSPERGSVTVIEEPNGRRWDLPLAAIRSARLEPEF